MPLKFLGALDLVCINHGVSSSTTSKPFLYTRIPIGIHSWWMLPCLCQLLRCNNLWCQDNLSRPTPHKTIWCLVDNPCSLCSQEWTRALLTPLCLKWLLKTNLWMNNLFKMTNLESHHAANSLLECKVMVTLLFTKLSVLLNRLSYGILNPVARVKVLTN